MIFTAWLLLLLLLLFLFVYKKQHVIKLCVKKILKGLCLNSIYVIYTLVLIKLLNVLYKVSISIIIIIFLDVHSTKQGLSLVDRDSYPDLDTLSNVPRSG